MAIDVYDQLPVDSDSPNYTFTCSQDDVDYSFTFYFNDRSQKWYMNITLLDETEIVSGVPILIDCPLLTAVKEGQPISQLWSMYVNVKGGEDVN